MDELPVNQALEINLEGKDHGNIYDGNLDEQIAREMNAIARPKAKATTAP